MRSMELTKAIKSGICQSHISSVEAKNAAAYFAMTGDAGQSRYFMGLTWSRSLSFVEHFILTAFTTFRRSFEHNGVAEAGNEVKNCIRMRFETDSVGCSRVVCCRGEAFHYGDSLSGQFLTGSLFFNFIIMSEANTIPYEVYSVVDLGKNKKPLWHHVGVAFRNSDGSLGVILNSLPVNGTLNIRKKKSKDADSQAK